MEADSLECSLQWAVAVVLHPSCSSQSFQSHEEGEGSVARVTHQHTYHRFQEYKETRPVHSHLVLQGHFRAVLLQGAVWNMTVRR